MRLSIRNQLAATIVEVNAGQVMSTVKARLAGGREITAAITLEGAEDLGLARGDSVLVLIKSTEVAVATAPVSGLSIRNQLPGTISEVDQGTVMTTVKVDIAGGDILTAAITRDAAEELKLEAGVAVTALVKSTEVGLAVV
jgi:molybdate transport system regulatory protein